MKNTTRDFLSYIVGAPLVSISICFLTTHLPVFTLMGSRFFIGALVLSIYCLFFLRRRFTRVLSSPNSLFIISGLAMLQFGGAYCWVQALKYSTATSFQIIDIAGIPLAIFLGAFFFINERKIVKDRSFQLGTLLALLGTGLSALAASSISVDMSIGTYYAILGTLFFCVLSVAVRGLAYKIHPVIITTVAAIYQTFIFSSFAFTFEQPSLVFECDSYILFVLVLSGIYGNAFWGFVEIPLISNHGLAVQKVLSLLLPLSAGILELLILGNVLALSQVWPAIIVAIGAYVSLSRIYGFNLAPEVHLVEACEDSSIIDIS